VQKKDFYASGAGDRLIDDSHYPNEVQVFLRNEVQLLEQQFRSKSLLVEVGCMSGRYVDWAHAHGCRYLGIDVVERFVQVGNKRLQQMHLPDDQFRIILVGAQNVSQAVRATFPQARVEDILCLYPFNSIGNMMSVQAPLASLAELGSSFFVSSYQTSPAANRIRLTYYHQAGYLDVRSHEIIAGVLFSSSDGLHTIAYHPDLMLQVMHEHGLRAKLIPFQDLGASYISPI
jgi:hypothetical protein